MAVAPGKVILLGEHAVVYDQPALAAALDVGVEVVASAGSGVLRVPAWSVVVRPGGGAEAGSLGEAYDALRAALAPHLHGALPAVDLEARFAIPTGSGLGSSAALSVAIARALGEAAGVVLGVAALEGVAMASEKVFHGRPSGIDAAVSAAGGFGLFTRAAGLSPIAAAAPVPLVIGHTGRERDTKGRVARVAEILAERPAETRAHFDAIGELVRRAAEAISRGDFEGLGAAMRENQRHLAALEVSSVEIERMCALAAGAGALGEKLTGGGGGGCVIALAPGREAEVQAAWAEAGFRSFATRVGGKMGPGAAAEARAQETR